MSQVTELLDVPRPIVVGFLRAGLRTRRQSALKAALWWYCDRHEFALDGVITESPQAQAPDEFESLLASIKAGEQAVYGLVVPSHSHLGMAAVARRRGEQIASARLRLLVVRQSGSAAPGEGVGDHA
jgi:hypothetical protein